jgi:hypothetical protein
LRIGCLFRFGDEQAVAAENKNADNEKMQQRLAEQLPQSVFPHPRSPTCSAGKDWRNRLLVHCLAFRVIRQQEAMPPARR